MKTGANAAVFTRRSTWQLFVVAPGQSSIEPVELQTSTWTNQVAYILTRAAACNSALVVCCTAALPPPLVVTTSPIGGEHRYLTA